MSKRLPQIAIFALLLVAYVNSLPALSSCNHFWVGAEYLYWKIRNSPNPVPFVVTAPFANNRLPLIGQPGTKVLIGDKNSKNHWRSGARFTLGWYNEECCFGAEANYFFLPHGSKRQSAASSGLPGSIFLSVPYFDTFRDRESSSPLAEPGVFRATTNFKIENRLQGAELNGFAALCGDCCYRINALAGFRYLNFHESLKFNVDSPANSNPTEIFLVKDRFRTRNNFYGGQIGLSGEVFYNCFFLNAKAKLALGAMDEKVSIRGKFITNAFDGFAAPQTFLGGYFALPSNIGNHKGTRFAVIPEVNLNLGYQIMDCLRIQLGYTFLYVNKILWAGKQVNRNINPTQSSLYDFTANPVTVGKPSPKSRLKNSYFWLQGLNVGLEWDF